MKGAEEDIAGNYFKPVRVNRLIAQAQESQRVASKLRGTISSGTTFQLFYNFIMSTRVT